MLTVRIQTSVAVIESATVGDPFDPGVVFGPVISQSALDRILGAIEEAITQHAGELALGGKRIGGELAGGYFLEPTVFTDVDNPSALAQTETFGPVVVVMKFNDETEAVHMAKRHGLRLERLRTDHRSGPRPPRRTPTASRLGVDQPAQRHVAAEPVRRLQAERLRAYRRS